MIITLQNLGKRYNLHWIFRNLNYTLSSGNWYALTGPNGSGKSTLLLLLAGQTEPRAGKILAAENEHAQPTPISENWFQQYSISAPYVEIIEELTLREMLDFHFKLKPSLDGMGTQDIITHIGLEQSADKQIRNFSSGMKQKTKLAMAIFANTPVLLLDEPGSNLDADAFTLYQQMLYQYASKRLVVIGSNQQEEIASCGYTIHLPQYK